MVKIRNQLKFVRYGGLSSVPQRGYKPSCPTFHAPPANRGIYAFVWPLIERFLLSTGFDGRRMQWLRDAKGQFIDEHHPDFKASVEKFACYPRKGVATLAELLPPTFFNYSGEIWHHLEAPHHEVLARRGSWALADIKSYARALRRELGRMDALVKREGFRYSRDHLEVFIEKV